jgi:hypothetical protein
MSAFDAVVLNDQNDGSGCQKVTCAQRAVPDFRARPDAAFEAQGGAFRDCFSTADGTGPFAASMAAWSRTLFGSPVVGDAYGSCDRERRCAEQIRIAIVLIGNGIAQPMRSPLGD